MGLGFGATGAEGLPSSRIRELVRSGSFRKLGALRVPLKGYYKGTIRVPLKGSIRVKSFRKLGVP